MDLHKIRGADPTVHPEGYRIGWIAFDSENPSKRVLFDSHPPKGIHFHVDGESEGISFVWKSIAKTEQMFFAMVCRHFNIDEEELV